MDIVPELVAKETKVQYFLYADNNDPSLAAKRIALYWKYRKVYFGERWMLPMVQTGTGALSWEDVEYLRCGYCVPLQTATGRTFFLVDIARFNRPRDLDKHFRYLFYLGTILEGKLLRTKGATTIKVVTSSPRGMTLPDGEGWQRIRTGLPMKIEKVLVGELTEIGRERYTEYLSYQASMVAEHNTGSTSYRLRADSPERLLSLFREHNVPPEFLPPPLGGTYNYSQFSTWVHQRVTLEETASSAPFVQFLMSMNHTSNDTERGSSLLVSLTKKHHSMDQNARNAMYMRRSLQQRQLMEICLDSQAKLLERQNRTLRRQNQSLEDALASALEIVSTLSPAT